MITYEYPFNERIRTLLRLEDLFEKTAYFAQEEGVYEHHTALVSMFEILEVASRADLKMDLIQEIHRRLPDTHLVMHGSSSVPRSRPRRT